MNQNIITNNEYVNRHRVTYLGSSFLSPESILINSPCLLLKEDSFDGINIFNFNGGVWLAWVSTLSGNYIRGHLYL